MKKYKINISAEHHCRDLESISSIFMPIIKDMISAEDLIGIDIVLNWSKVVGEEIASFCNPLKTKYNQRDGNRILYVEVPVGGFALELQHKENYVLDKVNSYIGYKAIHKLNISQNMNMQPKLISTNKKQQNKELKLTEEQKNYLQNVTKEIKDENLRKILINIGQNVITEQKE